MTRAFVFVGLLFSISVLANPIKTGFDLEEAKTRCLTHYSQSPEIYADDFHWGYTLLEMQDRFEEIYNSGKRLNLHSQYLPDKDQFIIYFDHKPASPVVISENFIKNVTTQIEVAIEHGFAQFVFFPDMGHSHLYFPQDHWDAEYKNLDFNYTTFDKLYEKMLNDPKMRPLYHLTEQLKMTTKDGQVLPDQILSFKYWHRNFLGFNDGPRNYDIKVAPKDQKFNTVVGIDGYFKWSAGFAVHASKDGCFPYIDKDGKTRYFDIGLQDPRYDPARNTGDF